MRYAHRATHHASPAGDEDVAILAQCGAMPGERHGQGRARTQVFDVGSYVPTQERIAPPSFPSSEQHATVAECRGGVVLGGLSRPSGPIPGMPPGIGRYARSSRWGL